MQKNRLIWITGVMVFSLLLGGCDAARMKLKLEQQNAQIAQQQDQIAQQQQQIESLQDQIDDLEKKHDEKEKLASEFNA